MNPYKEIYDLDKVIDNLVSGLKYSKNKSKDTENINTIIRVRNAFEDVLEKKYYNSAVEICIYQILLYFYKYYDIANGGDINASEDGLMFDFKNNFSLGKEYARSNVVDELRKYLDFHALKEGAITESSTKKEKELYFMVQDEVISEKLKERVKVLKSLIHFKLKK